MPSADTDEGAVYCANRIQQLNSKILFMVFYGHFNYGDCENMALHEFEWFYTQLKNIQDKEQESLEQSRFGR